MHRGNAWLYKPNLNTLREKVHLPVGSCELAIPLNPKGKFLLLYVIMNMLLVCVLFYLNGVMSELLACWACGSTLLFKTVSRGQFQWF